ncbi:MAG: tRNA 2-thiocytidine biosynthesis TtcA family protein [Oscillospiraceae bacterium]|nr:tRNA 2-thiocytidine biosynthesis TtcA family protein [Oscillospiraceae bacterium]
MLREGDRVAVGVSGGKDSLLTLWALASLRRFYPVNYSLCAITLDMGRSAVVEARAGAREQNAWSGVRAFCESLGVPYIVEPTNIFEVVFDIRGERSPCSLCAKMRRGALHSAALERGCNKVALGHHKDDAVETFMMSLIFEGRVHCFKPVTYLDRRDITLIRPLLYAEEGQVRQAAAGLKLPIVQNPCPANGNTRRQEIKELLAELEGRYPNLRHGMFGAIKRGGVL